MTAPRTDLLTPAEARRKLRALQGRMQVAWDSWHAYEQLCPGSGEPERRKFEALENDEAKLLTIIRGF